MSAAQWRKAMNSGAGRQGWGRSGWSGRTNSGASNGSPSAGSDGASSSASLTTSAFALAGRDNLGRALTADGLPDYSDQDAPRWLKWLWQRVSTRHVLVLLAVLLYPMVANPFLSFRWVRKRWRWV